jgi:hypothetical protein
VASDQKPTAQVDTAERLRLLAAPSRDSDWVRVRAIELRSAADRLELLEKRNAELEPPDGDGTGPGARKLYVLERLEGGVWVASSDVFDNWGAAEMLASAYAEPPCRVRRYVPAGGQKP